MKKALRKTDIWLQAGACNLNLTIVTLYNLAQSALFLIGLELLEGRQKEGYSWLAG